MSEFDAQINRMQVRRNGKREADLEMRKLKVAQHEAERDKKRTEMRSSMPQVAQFMDDMRSVFGQGVRCLYAEENGQVVKAKGFKL